MRVTSKVKIRRELFLQPSATLFTDYEILAKLNTAKILSVYCSAVDNNFQSLGVEDNFKFRPETQLLAVTL